MTTHMRCLLLPEIKVLKVDWMPSWKSSVGSLSKTLAQRNTRKSLSNWLQARITTRRNLYKAELLWIPTLRTHKMSLSKSWGIIKVSFELKTLMLVKKVKRELFSISVTFRILEKCPLFYFPTLLQIQTKRWAIVTLEASMELHRTLHSSLHSFIPQVVLILSPSCLGKMWSTLFWFLQATITPERTLFQKMRTSYH